MADLSDKELLEALGVEVKAKKQAKKTPREQRIIAGFEDIERFFEEHGRLPAHGEDKDIFERLYAVRLEKICASQECRDALEGLDKHGLLEGSSAVQESSVDDMDDEELLSELGVLEAGDNDITKLKHVKTRAEVRAAEEVARRTLCEDFDKFKPLFAQVQEDLELGLRETREYKRDAKISLGDWFILAGQKTYVAEMSETFKAPNGETDARLRVVYDNGTESNLLLRSLQRALYEKERAGRRITEPSAGPLFSDTVEDGDTESGTIYVLRSKSEQPFIKEHSEVIHKIGVTGGDLKKRFSNAKTDPTFLMADVEVVASYELSNINRTRLEKVIHKVFEPAKLDVDINDRFGNPVKPKEWFLVPLPVIDEAVNKIKDGSIVSYVYDPQKASLIKTRKKKRNR